jgi:hypothetical protein
MNPSLQNCIYQEEPDMQRDASQSGISESCIPLPAQKTMQQQANPYEQAAEWHDINSLTVHRRACRRTANNTTRHDTFNPGRGNNYACRKRRLNTVSIMCEREMTLSEHWTVLARRNQSHIRDCRKLTSAELDRFSSLHRRRSTSCKQCLLLSIQFASLTNCIAHSAQSSQLHRPP